MELMLVLLFVMLFSIDEALGIWAFVVWVWFDTPTLEAINVWFQGVLT